MSDQPKPAKCPQCGMIKGHSVHCYTISGAAYDRVPIKEFMQSQWDKDKPTGEWTAEKVEKLLGYSTHIGCKRIADAHNAALAATVHYWQGVATQEWHKGFAASHDEHQKQLAAEKDKLSDHP